MRRQRAEGEYSCTDCTMSAAMHYGVAEEKDEVEREMAGIRRTTGCRPRIGLFHPGFFVTGNIQIGKALGGGGLGGGLGGRS